MNLLLIILLTGAVNISMAQDDKKEVREVINNLFDGMRNSDSALVHSCFFDDVSLRSVSYNKKMDNYEVHHGKLQKFLNAIGSEKTEVWDERISNVKIHIDANLAQVWMDYSFYLGDRLNHCGVNSIQLIRQFGEWKISDLADTQRIHDCPGAK